MMLPLSDGSVQCFACGEHAPSAIVPLEYALDHRDQVVLCQICLAQALTLASGYRFDRNLAVILAQNEVTTQMREEQEQRGHIRQATGDTRAPRRVKSPPRERAHQR